MRWPRINLFSSTSANRECSSVSFKKNGREREREREGEGESAKMTKRYSGTRTSKLLVNYNSGLFSRMRFVPFSGCENLGWIGQRPTFDTIEFATSHLNAFRGVNRADA